MKRSLLFAVLAFMPFSTGALLAQGQSGGYHNVACIKLEPGKGMEYTQFVRDATSKYMQAMVDAGEIAGWLLLRSVLPTGREARCDYVSVTMFPGAPPEPPGREHLAMLLQKAGVGMTDQAYIDRRNALSYLVSLEMWRTALTAGAVQKGDYLFVNMMKVHNLADYMELEQTMWKPMAENWIAQGSMHGWMLNRPVLPGGKELSYQAVTVDVFPSWEQAMKPRQIEDVFKKVHPDKDIKQTFDRLSKARDLARRSLLVVQEKVSSGAASPESMTSADRAAPRK